MRLTPRLPLAYALLFVTVAVPAFGDTPSAEVPSDRATVLDDPLDFSNEPPVVEIDAPTAAEIRASMTRGVEFLLQNQQENGSWGSPTRTKGLNIYAPVPGAHHAFQAAMTALCIMALHELRDGSAGVDLALEKSEAWLLEHLRDLRRATGDAIYNVWGHGYAIQALVRMHARHADNQAMRAEIEELIRLQFEMLQRYESVDGGWGYYDFRYQANQPTSSSISFVNGAILVALAEARDIGVEPPERMVRRAVDATTRQQKSDFSYLYG
ncbi:MAG: hypothetical protein ACO32I_07940, partial [Candidatus Limnocylindrus sp.]